MSLEVSASANDNPGTSTAHPGSNPGSWMNVILAATLMLATLPGRTQGLGLITEPMLRDLHLDRVVYANLNLWATLLGACFCLPMGWILDRFGIRMTSSALVLLLGIVVWKMSAHTGSVAVLFALILLTRAFGQSALSVASITTVGKSFNSRAGMAMGVYSFLLSVFFAIAFVVIGAVVRDASWRIAWSYVAYGLLVIAPLVLLLLREPEHAAVKVSSDEKDEISTKGISLSQSLRTLTFWIFAGATALFGLVSSGLGLFNEAVLAERGFDQKTFHTFLAVSTLVALLGQLLCGWLTLRWTMQRLLGVAMLLYAASLVALPFLRTMVHLWTFAAAIGMAGGMITVLFFAVWGRAFGQKELGRIQGAAQMITVFASAVGPLLFAKCHALTGSYAPLLFAIAPIVLLVGLAAWRVSFPNGKLIQPQTSIPVTA